MHTESPTKEPEIDDGKLLSDFVCDGDERAFSQLINRHTALVYGVAWRVLGNAHDAEDATQAVFLVLARKAPSLQKHPTVAGWLHRVAWFVAKRSKEALMTRSRKEEAAAKEQAIMREENRQERDDACEALHDELQALPDKYRMPVILHHLQGHSEQETAALLEWKLGTLSGRLSRARRLLKERLGRRGHAGISMAAIVSAMNETAEAQVSSAFEAVTLQNAVAYAQGDETVLLSNGLSAETLSLAEQAVSANMIGLRKWSIVGMTGAVALVLSLIVYQATKTSPNREASPSYELAERVQPDRAQMPGILEAEVDAIFWKWNHPNTPGAAMAVFHREEIIFQKGYGMANLEHQIPINPTNTRFFAGSLTKQITILAAMLLVEEGKLSLSDNIRRYIPEFPDYGAPITLEHLANHTSGLRSHIRLLQAAGWRLDDVMASDQVLRLLCDQKGVNFFPGEEFSYCNSGFFLLALAIERVSGQSFAAFVQSKGLGNK